LSRLLKYRGVSSSPSVEPLESLRPAQRRHPRSPRASLQITLCSPQQGGLSLGIWAALKRRWRSSRRRLISLMSAMNLPGSCSARASSQSSIHRSFFGVSIQIGEGLGKDGNYPYLRMRENGTRQDAPCEIWDG